MISFYRPTAIRSLLWFDPFVNGVTGFLSTRDVSVRWNVPLEPLMRHNHLFLKTARSLVITLNVDHLYETLKQINPIDFCKVAQL